MQKLIILLVIASFFGCSSIKALNDKDDKFPKKVASLPSPIILTSNTPQAISPGEIKFIKLPLPSANTHVEKIQCKNRQIPFVITTDKLLKFFLAESYFSELTPFDCKLFYAAGGQQYIDTIFQFSIIKRDYKNEFINVAQDKVTLSDEDLRQVIAERERLKAVYTNSSSTPLFAGKFHLPLTSKITSTYGNKRTFNNNKSTQHLGIDFRAPVGTPIPATNAGKVVFAGDLFFSGKSVIIDHGLNLFTLYGHLSKILVTEGNIIGANTLIGHAGRTGRVSGPHLHWGVRVHDEWVDGQSLVNLEI
ncbi:MAG TPA: M23 family metallopeptidase [Bacteriovoracaceae bacterium]|nr:M23 family metallopeptidase [Bacteriovoracaceae bacterium]